MRMKRLGPYQSISITDMIWWFCVGVFCFIWQHIEFRKYMIYGSFRICNIHLDWAMLLIVGNHWISYTWHDGFIIIFTNSLSLGKYKVHLLPYTTPLTAPNCTHRLDIKQTRFSWYTVCNQSERFFSDLHFPEGILSESLILQEAEQIIIRRTLETTEL